MRRVARAGARTSLVFLALCAVPAAVHAEGGGPDIQPAHQASAPPNIIRWDHNGSIMRLDRAAGTITYEEPKPSISKTIAPGTVLFRGTLKDGMLTGKAHVFKKGCDPAPYTVTGSFQPEQHMFELNGAAPRWKGCKVVGTNPSSANSRLVFRSLGEHVDGQGRSITSVFTEGSGKHCKDLSGPDDGQNIDFAQWTCTGPMGKRIDYDHYDLRENVTIQSAKGKDHFQPPIANFNGLLNGGRIEWRLRDGKPFAAIFDQEFQSEYPTQVGITVVTRVDDLESCRIAYIDRSLPDARQRALDAADNAAVFRCGVDAPMRVGHLDLMMLQSEEGVDEKITSGDALHAGYGPPTTWDEPPDYLPVHAKEPAMRIYEKSGLGTASALAKARLTRKDAEAWCEQWRPDSDPATCASEVQAEFGGQEFMARADCVVGTITAVDGENYIYAGIWLGGDGKGRTRWRHVGRGEILDTSNAANGLGISTQWEALCPGMRRPAHHKSGE